MSAAPVHDQDMVVWAMAAPKHLATPDDCRALVGACPKWIAASGFRDVTPNRWLGLGSAIVDSRDVGRAVMQYGHLDQLMLTVGGGGD